MANSDEILYNRFIIKMFLKPFARTVQLFFGSQKESGNRTRNGAHRQSTEDTLNHKTFQVEIG
jgi:hypothetical protein